LLVVQPRPLCALVLFQVVAKLYKREKSALKCQATSSY
jgi:hypothetical protein